MILKRIQIEGYKALRNPVDLKDLGTGIHLIHGPNETGKSTLVNAVARALFDRYNTQDQEIKALRPWGTELAPRVVLEFETGGKTYRLEKRFLDQESSALSEWNGSRFERVADSVKADDQVRGFLQGTAAKSGASSLGNWGLARLLWMTQMPQRMSPPELDESLRQRLLGVMGSAVLGDREQQLLGKVDKAYDVYYTAAKQSEKKGSPLSDARERLKAAEEQLTHWKTRWDDVSRLNEAALDSQGRLAKLESERAGLDAEIAALRARAGAELELENLIKVKDQQALVSLQRWKSLNAASSEITELERAIAGHQAVLTRLEPGLASGQDALARAEAAYAQASSELSAATDAAGAVARELAGAAVAGEAKQVLQQLRDLEATHENAVGLEKARQARVDEYTSRKRPKDADVEEARALKSGLDQLVARIADLGIEVRFTPEREGLEVEWLTSDGKSKGAGESVFRSPDQGELVIPGVGRIRIRSGAEDSRKLQARADETRARFAAKLALYGVASSEELQALRASTAELEASGQAARAALTQALGPRFKTAAELAAELDRVRGVLRSKLEGLGMTEAQLSAAPAPDARALQERLAAAKARQEAAQRALQGADAAVRQGRKSQDEARAALQSARQGRELLGQQLAAKLAQAGGREAMDRELGEAALEKNSLEKERALLAAKLPPAEQRASRRLASLESARQDVASREESARKEYNQATALLTAAEGEGYYSKLAAAEEERALASELLARRESQARGTRVLRALAHAKRDRLNSDLMAPIEAAVTEIFGQIRGPQSSRLAFGSKLEDLGVKGPSGAGAELGTLSLGTQEQAMLALRLAFGQLLSERGEKPEPQLVVLDDPLVNADPERQARARELLKKASSKLQILILTARPEDYRGLEPKEYDLSALKLT